MMERISMPGGIELSRIVYGMWRVGDDADTSPPHIRAKIEACLDQGITTIIVEQNAVRALELADRSVILDTGSIVFDGTAAEVLEKSAADGSGSTSDRSPCGEHHDEAEIVVKLFQGVHDPSVCLRRDGAGRAALDRNYVVLAHQKLQLRLQVVGAGQHRRLDVVALAAVGAGGEKIDPGPAGDLPGHRHRISPGPDTGG